MKKEITFNLNGSTVNALVSADQRLLDVIRESLGETL